MAIAKSVGNRIKQIRKQHRLTQKELAKLLGVSQGAISGYEKGEMELNYEKLLDFCTFFQINISDLFSKTETNIQKLDKSEIEVIESIIRKLKQLNPDERNKLRYGINLAMELAEREKGE